ncbi:hypothetical protein ACFWPX_30055 [Nocardia sp. NPDC058518]|uniref:hypothetical protein n=1 Tax=Nocardia sp. NPDC058518 TaxID=3346534 RepID=UPI003658557A
MSGDMEGNIAWISEVHTFDREGGGENRAVYVTVIEDHDRRNPDGSYTPTGKSRWQFYFSRGRYADRIHQSFRVGDEVVITYDQQRASLDVNPANKEPQPLIRARGRGIGLACRTKVLTGVAQGTPDPATGTEPSTDAGTAETAAVAPGAATTV